MAEEFEGRDLSGAVFWGVDLSGARFRDVDLTGVRISHARVKNVEIDAQVEHVTINGVDVTDFVNERDPWYPLRAAVQASDPPSMRAAWATLDGAWTATIEGARRLTDDQLHQSVGGEWSFVETLRHLIFAMDKWFTVPIAGGEFHRFGLPNTGSKDFGWPGLDPDAAPSLDEVLAVRADRSARLRAYLESVTDEDLTRHVEVLENGDSPISDCIFTVFEEEFEHNRYATRDLAHLE